MNWTVLVVGANAKDNCKDYAKNCKESKNQEP